MANINFYQFLAIVGGSVIGVALGIFVSKVWYKVLRDEWDKNE